jgi:hypothetical protein
MQEQRKIPQHSHARADNYTEKRVTDFPVPSRDVTNKILPGGELIIPDQEEFD